MYIFYHSHPWLSEESIFCSLDSWICMWSFPAQAVLPHFLSVFMKALWGLSTRWVGGGRGAHKGGVVPRAAACHRGLIGRCCWAELGRGRLIGGRAVCLSPDSSLKTKCGWLERVPSPRRPAWDLWSLLQQWCNIQSGDLPSPRGQKISPNFWITFSFFFFFEQQINRPTMAEIRIAAVPSTLFPSAKISRD